MPKKYTRVYTHDAFSQPRAPKVVPFFTSLWDIVTRGGDRESVHYSDSDSDSDSSTSVRFNFSLWSLFTPRQVPKGRNVEVNEMEDGVNERHV